ncbi:glycine cleavage system p-protein [Anaeramoeba ignava]|uniref:glycine dehydrogenase (aminomethyl-transferring) n=1 Tax=Anaeramoeba ignava TaxID=1746090 RepID=A0A9Q0R5S0_ANAIG|nr:glycine cleavage system p-protein [Anaeramoeba ignava]|eukprot:Anaeramoba_ignava/a426_155.p2 GENE.a426_155~~a426_155.p2  ORF type:complete len:490 (+),score=148.38 a426_155:3730-5199(+)
MLSLIPKKEVITPLKNICPAFPRFLSTKKCVNTSSLDYKHRYLPHTLETRKKILATLGINSIDELFKTIPENARFTSFSAFDHCGMTEPQVYEAISKMADKNKDTTHSPFFLGAGIYKHYIPSVVDHTIQRGEFLTAYTPYQPEVSQGTLQTMFEFQTLVCLLTGMDVANATMYDGSTAVSEAVQMACRTTRRKKVIISGGLHPHYSEVIKTSAKHSRVVDCDFLEPDVNGNEKDNIISKINDQTACVVIQNPSFFGYVRDLKEIADACHKHKALLIGAISEIVSCGLIKDMGSMGVDIVAGEGQSLGLPMSFGGPHVGLFSTKQKYMRQMPGRLVGETEDTDGERGYCLTLGTREQHIRRETATSNICTSAGICAIAFSIHLALLGEHGFKDLAKLNHAKAFKLVELIKKEIPSIKVLNDTFFNEVTLQLPINAKECVDKLAEKNIFAGVPVSKFFGQKYDNLLLVASTETNSDEQIQQFVDALKKLC